jgi:hypothetical protein
MQLDQTRIPIRERRFLELMDLGLRLVRAHGLALLTALAVGVAPWFALNHWLLRDWVAPDEPLNNLRDLGYYLGYLTVLMAWQMPLATAPLTLYLGQVLFQQRVDAGRIVASFVTALPQLVLYQGVLRGLFMFPVLLGDAWLLLVLAWFWPFAARAYLNEVILLERNPMRRRPDGLSTGQRAANLHRQAVGKLFSQWLGSLLIGTAWGVAILLAVWAFRGEYSSAGALDQRMFLIYGPVAAWLVIGYLTIVRFLSYLDLRIRSEGWEIELRLRAEAARWEAPRP